MCNLYSITTNQVAIIALFPRYPTDPIVACTVVIADPIIQSLNDKHFTCLNHALMQELSTIGAAFLYAAGLGGALRTT